LAEIFSAIVRSVFPKSDTNFHIDYEHVYHFGSVDMTVICSWGSVLNLPTETDNMYIKYLGIF
jgi:hypothetical protein